MGITDGASSDAPVPETMTTQALDIFSSNLKRLMREKGPHTALAVERAATAKGLGVGRTSIGRYASGTGNPTLEHLESLSEVFGLAPWKLLHPALGNAGQPTIFEQLDALAAALLRLPPEARQEAGQCLERMAQAPEGGAARQRLEELLTPNDQVIPLTRRA